MGKINYTLLNASAVNASRLNMTGEPGKPGGGAGGYWPDGTPAAIRRSAVLWYDIAKQGATNETMAENPVLKDLSGHGHDATCYNFGWEGLSGVGGYGLSFSQYNKIRQDRAVIEFDGNYITIIKSVVIASWQLYNKVSNQLNVPAQRIKVANVPQSVSIKYCYRDATGRSIIAVSITKDGIYDIPSFTVPSGRIYGFKIRPVIDECNIIIEQLPQYPNALVSDGVDDYAYVDGLPLLDDFTFITKRTINAQKNDSAGALKGETGLGVINSAFGLDIINSTGGYFYNSFGAANSNPNTDTLKSAEIVVGTPSTINGLAVKRGAIADNFPYLWLMGYSPAARFAEEQLYTFLLFDRTLTEEEIEWVKNNLIGNNTEV